MKLFLAFVAFVAGALLVVATETSGIRQVEVPNVGPVFVWTPEEMSKLDESLDKLISERDALRRRVLTLEKQCV